ncbi:MAG TPA: hypothetical protein VKY90_00760 [Candidatus Dormibacteraeota bacterium]|nr:hypothetical protein [Candidatus Dormibacteraeota bacterium]
MEERPENLEGQPQRPYPIADLRELEEQTQVGEIFLAALLRRQLSLSLRVALTLLAMLGLQPLLAWLIPAYASTTVLSIPLPWLVLGLGSYPALIALGAYYVRNAERVDDEFSDLMHR